VQAASNSRNALPALIAARRIGAKFIYEVRGLWELTAATRLSGWEKTERYRLDRDLEVLIASHADHVLTITQGVADELILDGVSPDRLSLLPNAVDPEIFRPMPKDPALLERLKIAQDDFVLAYAGSLTVYEGLDDVIAALPRLLQAGIQPKFIVAGDGEYRQHMQRLAASLGVSDRVTFAGRVRPDEIQAYLSLADVVTIPRKPFKVCMVVSPLKPFEAMAMEKALILSDLPALTEIVEDGKTGLICKAADPADLAAVLERLARKPDLRGELGRAARRWVVEKRSWVQNAANLKELYEALTTTVRSR
jgi:glycosyltransferase involved in cell wall biosynthesis